MVIGLIYLISKFFFCLPIFFFLLFFRYKNNTGIGNRRNNFIFFWLADFSVRGETPYEKAMQRLFKSFAKQMQKKDIGPNEYKKCITFASFTQNLGMHNFLSKKIWCKIWICIIFTPKRIMHIQTLALKNMHKLSMHSFLASKFEYA